VLVVAGRKEEKEGQEDRNEGGCARRHGPQRGERGSRGSPLLPSWYCRP
jgi:hypothetical protein